MDRQTFVPGAAGDEFVVSMWQEWRGPRKDWSRRTKIASWVVLVLALVAWMYVIDRLGI